MSNTSFWAEFYDLGKAAGARFPELLAAQASLESGWGSRLSGRNNYFGIKGKPGTVVSTQEWVNGKFITVRDEFKDFDSPLACVQYLVDRWYKDYKGYEGVNRADSRDSAAHLLKEEGYATDPTYPQKLIRLMDDYQEEVKAEPPSDRGTPDAFILNAVRYFNEEPHQIAAWEGLWGELDPVVKEEFMAAYRGETAGTEPEGPVTFPLDVPYFYQRDSKTGHGERMCFSSSMAMALDYINPDAIEGDDDWYLQQVFKFGDSVSSSAQVAAAHSLGFAAEFRMDGTEELLLEILDSDTPVPVGILHHGSIEKPSGGGHWICLIGYDEKYFHVHDPFGELSLSSGGYSKAGPADGENQLYTRENLMKRWLISSDHDGWLVDLR